MKHNDRLDIILQSALRPYGWKAIPGPKLSEFLDFEVLLSWYNTILLFEMRGRVDEVLAVWKDPSKDVSGASSLYSFKLPWIPLRARGDSGIFMTLIPEDCVEYLMTYLSHARLKKENVARSFQDCIGRLDNKVLLSFISGFMYLSEEYTKALSIKNWMNSQEEELIEYCEWLCSVSNDADRVRTRKLLSPVGISVAKLAAEDDTLTRIEQMLAHTYEAYKLLTLRILDHLSCILLTFHFHGHDDYFDSEEYCMKWLDGTIEASTESKKDHFFVKFVLDFKDILIDKVDFLEPECYFQLIKICAGKFATFYLSFLRHSLKKQSLFLSGGPEIKQIRQDIAAMQLCFQEALRYCEVADRTEEAISCFHTLENCATLMECKLNSPDFITTLNYFTKLAEQNPSDARAITKMLKVCLGLSGVKNYRKEELNRTKSIDISNPAAVGSADPSVVTRKRGSLLGFSFSSQEESKDTKKNDGFTYGRLKMFNKKKEKEDKNESKVKKELKTNHVENDDIISSVSLSMAIDDEEEMEHEMIEMANAVFMNWVYESIDKVTEIGDKAPKYKVMADLISLTPECRVFESVFKGTSIKAQLVRSCLAPEERENDTPVKATTFGLLFNRLFRSNGHGSMRDASERFKHMDSVQNLSPKKASGNTGSQKVPTSVLKLIISDILMTDLFFIDSLSIPKPFLTFKYDNIELSTAVKEGINPNWKTEKPIEIPICSSGASSMNEVVVSLHYQGYLYDQFIGKTKINFSPFDLPNFIDQLFEFDFEGSPKAISAAQFAKHEGRRLPKLFLTISSESTNS